MKIAAAQQCDVRGNAQAGVQYGSHRSHGYVIVETKDRIRARGHAEQFVHGIVTCTLADFLCTACACNVFRAKHEAILGKSAFVTFQSSDQGTQFRRANMGNPLAANFDQVPGGDVAQKLIINAHEVGRKAFEPSVQQNMWNTFFPQQLKHPWAGLRGRKQQCVHAPGNQLIDNLFLEFRLLLGRRNKQCEARSPQFTRRSTCEFRKKA